MFGSVCWSGNISKLDRGRLEKIVKKKKKKAGHVVGKPLDSFKTLLEKRLYRKLMQILNDPTHPMRHSFDTTGVEDFYIREQIQTVIKPRFYPRLCQFLMKIIPVINWVCTCVKRPVSKGGLGMCQPNDVYLFCDFFTFWLTLFQVILGLL